MFVLCDYHHDDLYNSMRMLFEGRLGHRMYRPIGIEWFQEGFWGVYNHPATAEQYLGLHQGQELTKWQQECPEAYRRWLNEGLRPVEDGVYAIPDQNYPGKYSYGITLAAFKEREFGMIVSSMPAHFEPFDRLRHQYKPHAKHIFQSGNHWSLPAGVKNHLCSTRYANETTPVPNTVYYHQEFDLNIYKPAPCTNPRSIANFCHWNDQHYRHPMFQLEGYIPDFVVKEHGAGNRDGPIPPGGMADAIRSYGFIWHMKKGGDGYGYNIHHAVACGRPVIFKSSEIAQQRGGEVLVHNVSGLDMDTCGIMNLPQALRDWVTNYEENSARTYNHFKSVVDFEREYLEIQNFLARLI